MDQPQVTTQRLRMVRLYELYVSSRVPDRKLSHKKVFNEEVNTLSLTVNIETTATNSI